MFIAIALTAHSPMHFVWGGVVWVRVLVVVVVASCSCAAAGSCPRVVVDVLAAITKPGAERIFCIKIK